MSLFLSYSITFPPCGYLDFRTTTKIKYFCGGEIITTDKLQQVAREIDLILVTKIYLCTLKNRRTNVGPATRAIHRPTIGRHVDITEEPRAIISTCSVGARRVVLRWVWRGAVLWTVTGLNSASLGRWRGCRGWQKFSLQACCWGVGGTGWQERLMSSGRGGGGDEARPVIHRLLLHVATDRMDLLERR